MQQKIIQIGNSLGITLPKEIRQEMSLTTGDSVTIEKQDNAVIITPLKKKKNKTGVDAKFMQMVDEFMTENADLLKELANR